MKIIALTAENVKRLSAVHIEPSGNLVQITGRNGAGKTSVLDAISWAIEGVAKVQAVPIRKGQDRATIRLDLGDVIVTREFRRKEDGSTPSTIRVESAEGARFPSPQALLNSFLGAFTFDPLTFTRMDAKQQFDALRQFVPGVDFEETERRNKADFDKRTDVNRRAKDARAAAGQIVVPIGLPDTGPDEAALVAQLEQAGQHNAEIEARRARRQAASEALELLQRDRQSAEASKPARLSAIEARRTKVGADIEAQIDALQAKLVAVNADADAEVTDLHDTVADACKVMDAEIATLQARLDGAGPLPEQIDTAAVRQQIDAARTTNAGIAARAQRAAHDTKAGTLEAESKTLTDAMTARKAAAQAAVAAAKMPVGGIEFGEGIVLLNGVPFDQASDAEQLRTSIAIAMASNPKLRVIRVRDGSLLDEEAMTLLAGMADEADCQVWVERVDSTGSVGFVIADGQVAARPAPVKQSDLLGAQA